jgi:hypothetical protein
VLLVESDEDNRYMYADHLRRCGFTAQTADTTDDGLIRASKCRLALDSLLESKFLCLKPDGAHARAIDGAGHQHPTPATPILPDEYRKQGA